MTLFCDRNGQGAITAIYRVRQSQGQGTVDSAAAEVAAFYASLPTPYPMAQLMNRVASLETNVNAIKSVPAVALGLPGGLPVITPSAITN